MTIDVMCSCCGNHQKLSNEKIQDTVDLIHKRKAARLGKGRCNETL